MVDSGKVLERKIDLHEKILRCLLKYGEISVTEFRKLTIYKFSTNEVSAALKGLKRIGLVTYKGRVWYLNQDLIKSLGLLDLPELVKYVLETR